ncbi:MAG: hypothetical protein R2729_08505 [Bryobacteraceae bacterium]
MDRVIEEHLEDYLRGTLDPNGIAELERALAADAEAGALVKQFRAQADLLRELRPPQDAVELEPAPGFYARVMNRVEAERAPSIWSVFAEPLFFRRLAFASGALLVLLGVLMATGEPRQQPMFADRQVIRPEIEMAREPDPVIDVTTVSSGDRARILVDLTTYEQ